MKTFLFLISSMMCNYLFAQNVGIGTTAPQQKLSVTAGMNIDQADANVGNTTNTLLFGSGSGEGIGSKRTSGGNQYGLDFYTNFNNRMSINQFGNVGIGTTSPGTKLQLHGGIFRLSTSNKNWDIAYDSTNNYFYIDEYGASRRFIIANGGNVGIGTTSPSTKLDVSGDIKANGFYLIRSNNSSTPQKQITFAGDYATSLGAGGISSGTVAFEGFSSVPVVYVANYSNNAGGNATDLPKVIITLTNVTTSSCTVNFYNPSSSSISFNGHFNFVAVGAQ